MPNAAALSVETPAFGADRIAAFPVRTPEPVAAPPLSSADRALLETLRGFARDAQLSGALDLHHVCSLIEPGGLREHGRALLRALDVLSARPLVFHPRGAEEAGFDELWLLRLVRALQAGDSASARLLIGGRVPRSGRRVVAWLARAFAERAALDFGMIPD
jgi:hypothetical protein